MTALAILAAIYATAFISLVLLCATAPVGHEIPGVGFRYGPAPLQPPLNSGEQGRNALASGAPVVPFNHAAEVAHD